MESKLISAQTLRHEMEAGPAICIVDVRSPSEFVSGHIRGAVNVPLEQLQRETSVLPPNCVIVCRSGMRAKEACQASEAASQWTVLEGGLSAWEAAGFPVVRHQASRWSIERQVRLAAGSLVLVGVTLSWIAHPGWMGVAAFVGAGLVFAGLTDWCGMGLLFARMPWNRPFGRSSDGVMS